MKSWRVGRDVGLWSAAGMGLLVMILCGLMLREQWRTAREIEELRRAVNQLAKLPSNANDSEKAASLGLQAIRDGKWEIGQIYFINAVTNDPRNLGLLRKYAGAMQEGHEPPHEAIERLASILQLSAYQVDSAEVPKLVDLIDQVERMRNRVDESASTLATQNPDFSKQWENLSQVGPKVWQDPAVISSHIAALSDFIESIDTHPRPPDGLKAKASAEMDRWNEIGQASRQCQFIDRCLARLEGEDFADQRVVSIIQTAENALPSFWGMSANLPPDLKAKINEYPLRIQRLVDLIGRKRSESGLQEIKNVLSRNPEPKQKKLQKKCKFLEDQIKQAQQSVVQLSSTTSIREAQELIEKKSAELRKLRNDQYYEYQIWAINLCDETFKDYNSYTFFDESKARTLFKNHELAEIDQALLSPEVSRIFNDVLGKLTIKMNPKALVDTEKEMGTIAKKRLEDF